MESKYKVGDFVWNNIQDRFATIVAYHEKQDSYELDNGFMADEDDIEPLDKEYVKDSFLNELQCLLTKYDGEIVAHIGEDDATFQPKPLMYIEIGGGIVCNYENYKGCDLVEITPSNIFDYDK